MRLIPRFIVSYVSNFIALLVAVNLIAGIEADLGLTNLSIVVLVFTLLNMFLRPVMRMILSPLIVLTLGLFTIVINAGMLYLLDFISENITIMGLLPLIYATILISFINIFVNSAAKAIYKANE